MNPLGNSAKAVLRALAEWMSGSWTQAGISLPKRDCMRGGGGCKHFASRPSCFAVGGPCPI
jgi:hypothetical protein